MTRKSVQPIIKTKVSINAGYTDMIRGLLCVCVITMALAAANLQAAAQNSVNCKQLLSEVEQYTAVLQSDSNGSAQVKKANQWLEANHTAIVKCESTKAKTGFKPVVATCKQLLQNAYNQTKTIEVMASDSFEARKATIWLKTHQVEIQECQKMKANSGVSPAEEAQQTHPGPRCEGCLNSLIE